MLEDSDASLQPHAEIIIADAKIDCEMKRLQTKIKWKTEELAKSERTIATYKSKIEQLEKSVQTAHERLKKIENNIDFLRSSNQVKEQFIMSMKHEHKILDQKREETRITRDQIIDKYKQIFQSYKDTYKSLPWNQESRKLQIAIEIEKIRLNVFKTEYSQLKKKIFLFEAINDKRMTVAIVNLAKDLSVRNNLIKDINIITEETIKYKNKIAALKKEKDIIREQIDLKVKAAIAEVRERAVKAHTNVGTPKAAKPQPVPPTPVKPNIYSLLGLSGPLTLKRDSISILPLSEKSPRHSNIDISLPQYPWKQQDKISDIAKEKPEAVKNVPQRREVEKNANEPEEEVLLSSAKSAPQETPIDPPTKPSAEPGPEDGLQRQPENGLQLQPEDGPPTSTSALTSALSGSNESANKVLDKTNKTVDMKRKAADVPLVEKPEEIQEKITRPSPETVCIEEEPVQAKPSTVQTEERVLEAEIMETDNEDQLPVSEEQDGSAHIRPSPNKNKPDMLEESENFADNSMDNSSVLSLNFGINNRDELNELVSRNLDSPDFFIQRPGGFCFSPPFGKSSSPDKSDKGKKPVAAFMSPLFNEDNTKKAGGPSMSFDFFGSSSPKKDDNSTKSFFQLFG